MIEYSYRIRTYAELGRIDCVQDSADPLAAGAAPIARARQRAGAVGTMLRRVGQHFHPAAAAAVPSSSIEVTAEGLDCGNIQWINQTTATPQISSCGFALTSVRAPQFSGG